MHTYVCVNKTVPFLFMNGLRIPQSLITDLNGRMLIMMVDENMALNSGELEISFSLFTSFAITHSMPLDSVSSTLEGTKRLGPFQLV